MAFAIVDAECNECCWKKRGVVLTHWTDFEQLLATHGGEPVMRDGVEGLECESQDQEITNVVGSYGELCDEAERQAKERRERRQK